MTTDGSSAEYHVSVDGSDDGDGSSADPFGTVSAAAEIARPGDIVTVHEGTYRERVDPPRGGESDDRRIVYRAADGADVTLKGSERVTGWEHVRDDTWQLTLPNDFFGEYNPYDERIRGDWFNGRGRDHHTGDLYVDGRSLPEAGTRGEVLFGLDEPHWHAEVEDGETTIWASFGSRDPTERTVEINVRPTVFYPSTPGQDYLTVRRFKMRHAATQWAPPTTEQVGLLGTHWSKGWVIEDNVISHSRCTGITLGKYGPSVDETGATAERYNDTIRKALDNGWERGTIGHHVVRDNEIHSCEQAGIVGSMGAAFSEITGNHVHDINVERQFTGAEIAGIKFHGPVDSTIANNRVHHARRGIWLDWMTQGTRVTGNLLYGNTTEDLFVEVNHGPFVVDNNVMFSSLALRNWSQGGAYVHNLFAGDVNQQPELDRETPHLEPHGTAVAGITEIEGGDDRFYNNLFVSGNGLVTYNDAERPVWMGGNVFFDGAMPSEHERSAVYHSERVPTVELFEEGNAVFLHADLDRSAVARPDTDVVTTDLLGRVAVPDLPYVDPEDASLRIETDYFGTERETTGPVPGPFADVRDGPQYLALWPR
jgi:alpha-N-arabinofuranosidase